jgi:N-hydroxyarylamine O-acetyltransferase
MDKKFIPTPVESDRTSVCMDGDLLARYLEILGVSRKLPSLQALTELVAAHLTRVPFENISKLYYKKQLGLTYLPTLRLYLDGIEHYRFGGTCYSNNFYFYSLLASLGYQVKLCAADMTTPDVHAVSMVTVGGYDYLVDTGYAAPFLSPLPRDLDSNHVIALGRDRYVLRPQDADRCSRLELHRDGVLKHGYLAKPAAKKIEDFSRVIGDSFQPDATFLNSILLARFYPGRSIVIHNLTLIESRGAKSVLHRLQDSGAVIAAIHEHFGVPRDIVAEAIADLKELQDAWGDPFLGGRKSP